MYQHQTLLRVRYAETDKMGYLYYGHYATYFEVARVEMMRSLGRSYKQMEDDGIMMPVVDMNIKYIKPAFYDDELNIVTTLGQMPKLKMHFEYQVFNQHNHLLTQATTTLVFVPFGGGRPTTAPKWLTDALLPYFQK